VTRFRGEGLMQKNWRKKEKKERWCDDVKEKMLVQNLVWADFE
jgi:hypothetical protein